MCSAWMQSKHCLFPIVVDIGHIVDFIRKTKMFVILCALLPSFRARFKFYCHQSPPLKNSESLQKNEVLSVCVCFVVRLLFFRYICSSVHRLLDLLVINTKYKR